MAVLAVGRVLGKYQLIRHLGSGGMGAVYEATHVEAGKRVALKVLGPNLTADAHARSRFLREAAAASKIQHPHVVNVIDFGAGDGIPFIVMQFLRGEDLRSLLDRHPRGLPIPDLVDVMLAVCAGVAAAHQAGVIHRDLKPHNIFLSRGSAAEEVVPKVLDFGIAKVESALDASNLTSPGSVLGTTSYMSPEQISGGAVDGRTDQYALGVVLFQCLTGHLPFADYTGEILSRKIREGKFFPPSRLRPDLPSALEAVIVRAMARRRDDRFLTVDDLGAALLPFASPKKQSAWSEYYSRRSPDGPQAGLAGPKADERAPLNRSLRQPPAPVPVVAIATTRELRPSSPTLLVEPCSVLGARGTRTNEVLARWEPDQPRPAWMPVVLVTAALLLAAAAIVWRVVAEEDGSHNAPEASEVPAPVPSEATTSGWPKQDSSHEKVASATPDAGTAAALAAQSEEVTIRVVDPPPGLLAIVDGHALDLPMKLRRGAGVVVTFRAPGFESKVVEIAPSVDRSISLRLKPVEPERDQGQGRGRASGRYILDF